MMSIITKTPIITETDWTSAKPPHQYKAIATKHCMVAQNILSRGPTFFSFANNVDTTYDPESDEVMKKRQIVINVIDDKIT